MQSEQSRWRVFNGVLISAFLATAITSPANAQAAPTCEGKPATIYVENGRIKGGPNDGQPYDGILLGTPGDDVIVGTSGDDIIQGLGGDDTICAGPGNDSVAGGLGKDSIDGGPGDDSIRGD